MRKNLYLTVFFIIGAGACSTMSNEKMKDISHQLASEVVPGTVFAAAVLEPRSASSAHGKAVFSRSKDGLQVFVSVYGAEPGFHGIHIHETGDCRAHDASSAGSHYNPTTMTHGHPDPKSHHIGDLGNIAVGENGYGLLSLAIPRSRFHKDFLDWDQLIGKALILHSHTDDLQSQPTGNAGHRVACAVIVKN